MALEEDLRPRGDITTNLIKSKNEMIKARKQKEKEMKQVRERKECQMSVEYKSRTNKVKESLSFSDYQKSDRDFAFVVDKQINAQNLIEVILDIDNSLIKDVKIFDVYEGENIPSGKKSIALKVTIQSDHKTLNENDLTDISNKIVNSVEEKIGAKLRS